MADFVDVPINVDAQQMVDTAIDTLSTIFAASGATGWQANQANLEILLLGAIAGMASDTAALASQVPSAIFRRFGTKLAGIPYIQGAAATVDSTWTATDTLGHTIPGGTYVDIAGLGFYVVSDTSIPSGASSVTNVLLVAVEPGALYNAVSGPASLVDSIDWVQAVTIIGSTSGGADPESDDDYQNRLAALLALQAPRPITASDYQTFVLSFSPASGSDQQEVGRAVAIDGYQPDGTTSFTASVSSGSTALTGVSGAGAANVGPGSIVAATGIAAGSVVLTNTGTVITLNTAATGTASSASVAATGVYNQERCVTDVVAAADGTALNSDTLTAIKTWLQGFREANFLIYVQSPTYTTMYVTFQVKCYPSADPAGTVTAVQTALASYLSPSGFGQPPAAPATGLPQPGWVNDTMVRYNKLIGICEQVAGVDYVVSLTVGTAASPTGTSDVPIPGPVPLAQSTTSTIVGSAA